MQTKLLTFATTVFCVLAFALGCQDEASRPKGSQAKPKTDFEPGVVLLRYMTGSGSTEQRELGFLKTLEAEFPSVRILSTSHYAGTTPESSKAAMEKVLGFYGDAVQGVFAVCEPNSDGALRALEAAGKTDKVKLVGFDPNPVTLAAMREGKMAGIVVQDPVQMGYVAVQTLHAKLTGEEVEPTISTGEYLATPENMDDEALQPMLRPDRFSGKPFAPDTGKYRIAMIPKGRTHEFWEAVHQGAEKAAREAGDVRIVFRAPILEEDVKGQIDIFRGLVAEGIDGICLAPIDAGGMVPEVQFANEKGVPVVVFDSDLYDKDQYKVSYVATDNFRGGALAARRLAEVLGHSPTTTAPAEVKQDNADNAKEALN